MNCRPLLQLLICFTFSAAECSPELFPNRFEGYFEEYAEHPLDLIAKFIPENPVIFEAGGHYGFDTAKFVAKWPKATIITFEANPAAFQKFLAYTKDFPTVQGYNLAVNSYNGVAILNVCYGTTGDNPIYEGASSLLEASEWQKIHYQGPKVAVPCVILDDWRKNNNIPFFDFLWLDLEGLELQVLKSSPEILKKARIIFAETNFQEFRVGMTQYKDLKAFLEHNGFMLLAHWYKENLQGNAIFMKKTPSGQSRG